MNFSAFRRDYREHGISLACAAADSACVPGAMVAAWLNRIAAKASRVVHENGLTDKRYTVALESAGWPSPMYVARFDGDFLSASDTAGMAWRAAGAHKQARGFGGGLA